MADWDEREFAAQFDLLSKVNSIVGAIDADADDDEIARRVHVLSTQLKSCFSLLREHEDADVEESVQLERISKLREVIAKQSAVLASLNLAPETVAAAQSPN